MADACDDLVYLRVHHRFAAGDSDDGRTELGELVYPLKHCIDRHRIARLVVFVTVGTRQIAPPHWHNVYQNGMPGRSKSTHRVPYSACKPAETARFGHDRLSRYRKRMIIDVRDLHFKLPNSVGSSGSVLALLCGLCGNRLLLSWIYGQVPASPPRSARRKTKPTNDRSIPTIGEYGPKAEEGQST